MLYIHMTAVGSPEDQAKLSKAEVKRLAVIAARACAFATNSAEPAIEEVDYKLWRRDNLLQQAELKVPALIIFSDLPEKEHQRWCANLRRRLDLASLTPSIIIDRWNVYISNRQVENAQLV